MLYGTIIKYFSDKQFGFIRPDMGKDVFFHISVLDPADQQTEIKIGQAVKYEPMPREKPTSEGSSSSRERSTTRRPSDQKRAKVVVLIDRLPGGSLADSDTSDKPTHHERARKKKPTWRR